MNNIINSTKRINSKNIFFILFAFVGISLILCFSPLAYAHEQWFLTPQQILELNAKPRPLIFAQLGASNISILSSALFCVGVLILLNRRSGRELFPDHQLRLINYSHMVPVVLRFTTALMLYMAAFGLNPRIGVAEYTSPTFIFPDLELRLLGPGWMWLKWLEVAIATGLLLGIHVRLMACLLLASSFLGLYLFGQAMFYYFGFVSGISLYLLIKGPGAVNLPLPPLPGFKKLAQWFQNQPSGRAQAILRVLVGLDFAITGFIYKFLHPNLAIGLLVERHMPTFGLTMDTVVLWMALVETLSGLLLIFGVFTRPVAFVLLFCFTFMSFAVDDPFISHVIIYGALIACYINGAGEWKHAPARTKRAKIVILGASLSGIYSAIKLEALLGTASNVEVTLVHNDNYFQLDSLLPDVISGNIEPYHIVNPIRRICQINQVITGQVDAINTREQEIEITLLSGTKRFLQYDQLIMAGNRIPEHSTIPGMDLHALPIMNIGDALLIRKQVMECLEKAELTEDKRLRQMLLTFAVIGAGLRGTSVAAEIRHLIKCAILFYPTISLDEVKIFLLDRHHEILPTFDAPFAALVHKKLAQQNIEVKTNVNIIAADATSVIFSTGEQILCKTIISALSGTPSLPALLQLDEPVAVGNDLQVKGHQNIFVTGSTACFANKLPCHALLECKLGQLAAYNAWASSQGLKTRHLKEMKPFFSVASLGKHASAVKVGQFVFGGYLAWLLGRLVCMLSMPGLERNLRLGLDYLFSIVFRQDIVTFTPSPRPPLHQNALNQIMPCTEKEGYAYFSLPEGVGVIKKDNGEIRLIISLQKDSLVTNMTLFKSGFCIMASDSLRNTELTFLTKTQFSSLFTAAHGKSLRGQLHAELPKKKLSQTINVPPL